MKTVKNIAVKVWFIVLSLMMICSGCKKSSEMAIISIYITNKINSSNSAIDELKVIDEKNKSVSFLIPQSQSYSDWDITSLYLVYRLSDGASGSLKANEKIDFSHPVPFTVTAEDGSSVTYTITVNFLKAELLSFTFKELDPPVYGTLHKGIYGENCMDITIPFYMDLTGLTPVATMSEGCQLYYYNNESNLVPTNGAPMDFSGHYTEHHKYYKGFAVVPDNYSKYHRIEYGVEVDIAHLKIDNISKTSAAPGELLTLTGNFGPNENEIFLKKGQNTWDITVIGQNTSSINARIPASLQAGQYTLSVSSHGETANYPTPVIVAIPTGQPWITGLDKLEYRKGDQLKITGVNFPSGEITYINFIPVKGGVTVIKNVQVSGNTATLNAVPNELLSGVEYEVSVYFSGSDQWTNDYPILISN